MKEKLVLGAVDAVAPTNTAAGSTAIPSQDRCTKNPLVTLLSALWRSDERTHFLGTLDRTSGKFQNHPAPGISEAVAFAQASSAMGVDVYFGCAEFDSAGNRTAQNATGACALYADVDCGPRKPYSNTEEAEAAVIEFCVKAGFPMPTHIVNSGLGLHVYWALDALLDRDRWLVYAAKLKALMKAHGLRADPSRTADIASVLRVPGTLNHKYDPPKPVTLVSWTDEYIDLAGVLDAIDAAMLVCGIGTETANQIDQPEPVAPVPFSNTGVIEPPNLHRLESALKSLDPDCDEHTWKFYRLAPLAYVAREFPELADTLRTLAIRWSSGEVRGKPSKKWNAPGSNGLSGKQYFDRVWRRFLTDNYTGKRVMVGTIFYHANEAGWVYVPGHAGSTDVDCKGGL